MEVSRYSEFVKKGGKLRGKKENEETTIIILYSVSTGASQQGAQSRRGETTHTPHTKTNVVAGHGRGREKQATGCWGEEALVSGRQEMVINWQVGGGGNEGGRLLFKSGGSERHSSTRGWGGGKNRGQKMIGFFNNKNPSARTNGVASSRGPTDLKKKCGPEGRERKGERGGHWTSGPCNGVEVPSRAGSWVKGYAEGWISNHTPPPPALLPPTGGRLAPAAWAIGHQRL